MSFLFQDKLFNQPLNNWNVNNVTSYNHFKDYSLLSDANTPSKFK